MSTTPTLFGLSATLTRALDGQAPEYARGRVLVSRLVRRGALVLGVVCALGACESGTPTVRTYDTQGSSSATQGASGAPQAGQSHAANTGSADTTVSASSSAAAAPALASPTNPGGSGAQTISNPNDWDAAFDAAMAAPTFRVEPDAGLSSFTGFMIDAPSVRLSATASPAALDPAEVRALAQTLTTHLNDNLGESMTSTNVASAPGQTLRLRPTIARLAPRVDPTSPGGLSGVVFTQAACRVELVDAANDRVLATFVDASAPARALAGAARTDAELAQACLKLWAEQLAQRLDQVRSK